MERHNLIVRLHKTIKNFVGGKLIRGIASLAVAAAVTAALMIGCAPKPNNPNDPDNQNKPTPDITTPTAKYSKILNEILDSEYYNGLTDAAAQNLEKFNSAEFDPHPYAFLKKQGHNVDKIKSGALECRTVSYNDGNDLYMLTYVENEAAEPYYTEYTLKYSLTEQEMKEYKKLHTEFYIQAVFMNDVISANKKVDIISETKMNIATHKEMAETVSSFKTIGTVYPSRLADIILKDYDVSVQTFTIIVFPLKSKESSLTKYTTYFELNCVRDNQKVTVVNNIFYTPTSSNGYNIEEVTSKDISFYHSQDSWLGSNISRDFNETPLEI